MDFGLQGNITRRFTDLPNNISCMDTGFIRPQFAGAYLIQQDGAAAIIETGTSYSVPGLLEIINYKGISSEEVLYIIPTHVHLDHAGGAGQLMQALPGARLVVHPRGARHMIDPDRLWQGASSVYGEDNMHGMYGELLPVAEERIMVADDGFELDFNGRTLTFIDSPGHARHHFSIYDEMSRGFFTGDTFGAAYRELITKGRPYMTPITTPVQFDPDAWYRSLDRYLEFEPERMYVTHFGMVENVPQLAGDLRRRIQFHAETAMKYARFENRFQLIKSAITDRTLAELKKLGCPVPGPACKGLLEFDFDLNAAGLEIWVDRLSPP